MYSVTVRDHLMIAHSFTGEVFGPAQRLHGTTYIVDVELRRPSLDPDGIVVDIGRAVDAVHHVLAEINYRNLDELAEFRGVNTTTEVLAKFVFDRLAGAIRLGALGPGGSDVVSIRVTLHESHVAAACYDAPLGQVS